MGRFAEGHLAAGGKEEHIYSPKGSKKALGQDGETRTALVESSRKSIVDEQGTPFRDSIQRIIETMGQLMKSTTGTLSLWHGPSECQAVNRWAWLILG